MHDLNVRQAGDDDDRVDPAPTPEPDETGATEPGPDQSAGPGNDLQNDGGPGHPDCAMCDALETSITAHLETSSADPMCILIALSKVLTNRCRHYLKDSEPDLRSMDPLVAICLLTAANSDDVFRV